MNPCNRLTFSTMLLLCALALTSCGKDSPTEPIVVVQTPTRVMLTVYETTLTAIGQTVQIRATVLDQDSKAITGATVAWTSSDVGVATVNSSGLVTAAGNGSTLIKATAGALSASANVTVTPTVDRVAISPVSDTLAAVGDKVQLTATAFDGDSIISGIVFTWSSGDSSVATVGDNGLVTALSNGTAQVTATAGNKRATATVSVRQAARSITATPATVNLAAIGDTAQLTASVFDGRGNPIADAEATWSSSDAAIAAIGDNGLVTALSNGMATITVTAGNASATARIAVMQAARSMAVTPSHVSLAAIGDTAQLTATVFDSLGEPMPHAVTGWSSSDVSVVIVDAGGLVTAVMNGTARITATSGSVSAEAAVSVMQDVARIRITPTSTTLRALGGTVQTAATVYDANGRPIPDFPVNWSTRDPSVATVSGEGEVTAVGNGTTEITASAGGVSSGVTVTVAQRPAAVIITPPSGVLAGYGVTLQLAATVNDANGHKVPVPSVAWTSSDTNIATVSSNGLVTSEFHGTVLIRAEVDYASTEAVITVSEPPRPVRMTIVPPSATLTALGEFLQLSATVYDQQDRPMPGAGVTWSSDADSVAAVSETGLVTAVGSGFARVRAVSDSLSAVAGITVELPAMDREALIALYNSTDGPNWFQSQNWLTEEPIGNWYGVRADTVGRVLSLTLRNNRLSGPIPPEIGLLTKLEALNFESNALTGPIPPEFGQLEALTLLSLSNNPFTGGSLPGTLGGLKSLRVMVVNNTGLTGSIPAGIGQLRRLERLVMTGNTSLSGTIPTEIGGAGNLRYVDLSNNALSGSIPSGIGGLGNVEELDLSNNRLSGPLPNAIGGMSSLTELQLTGNQLSGPIPSGISGLRSLFGLWADNNRLSGTLPAEFGQLPNLEILDLSNNRLTGNIPAGIGNAPKLRWLDLGGNSGMSGRLPTQLTKLKLHLFVTGGRLCSPSDAAFQAWLRTITIGGATRCDRVTRVVVTPDRILFRALGDTRQLTAKAYNFQGEKVPDAKISWSSNAPNFASVSNSGLVTALKSHVGAVRIEAKVESASGIATGVSWITIAPAGELWKIVITPSAPRLSNIGDTVQLTINVYDRIDSLVTDYAAEWFSANESVAEVTRDGGLVTAAGYGSTNIIAFLSKDNQNLQKYVEVVVSSPDGRIELNLSSAATTAVGERIPFAATVFDSNNMLVSGARVTWSSSNPNVATVDASGLVTAEATGSTEITARWNNASVSTTLTVREPVPVGSIEISPSFQITMTALGGTYPLTATVLDTNGVVIDNAPVTWTSSAESVATVSRTAGVVTSVMNGSTTITARSGQATTTKDITVSQRASGMTWLYSFDERRTPVVGETFRLVFTFRDINRNPLPDDTQVIYHGTSDTTIATVTSGGDITALKAGRVDINYEVPAWPPDDEIRKASITIR